MSYVQTRHYSLPEGQGVPERITTGQQITVDGTAGTVRIEVAVP